MQHDLRLEFGARVRISARRHIVTEPERKFALDLVAAVHRRRNPRGTGKEARREQAAGDRTVVPFEDLHRAHCRADLPSDNAIAENFGHPVLDGESVRPGARCGVGIRQGNGPAFAPGVRQRAGELFMHMLHRIPRESEWRAGVQALTLAITPNSPAGRTINTMMSRMNA